MRFDCGDIVEHNKLRSIVIATKRRYMYLSYDGMTPHMRVPIYLIDTYKKVGHLPEYDALKKAATLLNEREAAV